MADSDRPSVSAGIGQKPQFQDLKLELKTHKSAEFSTNDNIFDIEMKTPQPLKTTVQLHKHKGGSEEDVQGGVFTQYHDNVLTFHLALPEAGWYTFNIFAKPLDSEGASLPCVFTYLIQCKRALKKVFPYPKQFADFKPGCFIFKPLFLDTTKDLKKVEIKVKVPGAKGVAVTAKDEWTHLTAKGGDLWQGEVSLEQHRGKNVDVKLNARFGDDATKFATLLMYHC